MVAGDFGWVGEVKSHTLKNQLCVCGLFGAGMILTSQLLLSLYFFGSNFMALSYTISAEDGPVFVAFSR